MTTDLATLQRARDQLLEALAGMALPPVAQVEVLASLSDECRARAGATEPDALDRLQFLWRQRQAQREALITEIRRGLRREVALGDL